MLEDMIRLTGDYCFFFFKQKTAYEMRISDWSSDVCSSDLYRCQIFNAVCGRDCLSDRRRNETLHHLLRRTRIAGIDYNRCAFHVGIFPHLQREERRTPGQENQEADEDREYRPPRSEERREGKDGVRR